jgi:hypothetical protein
MRPLASRGSRGSQNGDAPQRNRGATTPVIAPARARQLADMLDDDIEKAGVLKQGAWIADYCSNGEARAVLL